MAKLSEQVAALEARLQDAEQDACDSRLYRDVLDGFDIPYGNVGPFIANLIAERDTAVRRAESAERERDGWMASAKLAQGNSEYWRKKCESRVSASAREGAREALTRYAKNVRDEADAEGDDGHLAIARRIEAFRDREYPAPSAAPSGGARTPEDGFCVCGHDPWSGESYHRCRPTAPPQEPRRVTIQGVERDARWELAKLAMGEMWEIVNNSEGVQDLHATENDTWKEFRANGMLDAFDALASVMTSEEAALRDGKGA